MRPLGQALGYRASALTDVCFSNLAFSTNLCGRAALVPAILPQPGEFVNYQNSRHIRRTAESHSSMTLLKTAPTGFCWGAQPMGAKHKESIKWLANGSRLHSLTAASRQQVSMSPTM
jgi:hypothetical protein